MMKYVLLLILSMFFLQCKTQKGEQKQTSSKVNLKTTKSIDTRSFPEKCLGVWEGMMHIYSQGNLLDSVSVRFTAAKTETDGTFTWKTEYLSPIRPMVKDYKLVVENAEQGRYLLDEGNAVYLNEYVVGNKMHSMFQVDDIYLTSSTELVNEKLIFEVTSGRKIEDNKAVQNYSYTNVQRAVMKRVDD